MMCYRLGDVRRLLRETLLHEKKLNAYDVIGVAPGTPIEQVKKAYYKRAGELKHSADNQNYGSKYSQELAKQMTDVDRAYQHLVHQIDLATQKSEPKSRSTVNSDPEPPKPEIPQPLVTPPPPPKNPQPSFPGSVYFKGKGSEKNPEGSKNYVKVSVDSYKCTLFFGKLDRNNYLNWESKPRSEKTFNTTREANAYGEQAVSDVKDKGYEVINDTRKQPYAETHHLIGQLIVEMMNVI